MKKARQSLTLVRNGELRPEPVLEAGWEGLLAAYRALAVIPLAAASDEVMTRQIALARYATALLVRLRRLARNGPAALDEIDPDAVEDDET
jgi:hypothetical protein